MLNQGNWQTIFTATNQSDSLTIPLINPVELLLIKVSLTTPQPTWKKAGWVNQYWNDGENTWLVKSIQLDLNGELMPLILVDQSFLVFNPVPWLINWNIFVKGKLWS
jgi:hypothetical protein